MRIAIVEDEAVYTEQLRDYLRKYQTEFDRHLEVSCYDSGMNFIHSFRSQFDIILLDVAMPYIDGFETAQKIREQDSEVVLLFVTNQAQHAIRGYEVDAMDYILKPISYFAFSQRLNRAVSRVSRREEPCLVLNMKSGSRKLKIRDPADAQRPKTVRTAEGGELLSHEAGIPGRLPGHHEAGRLQPPFHRCGCRYRGIRLR